MNRNPPHDRVSEQASRARTSSGPNRKTMCNDADAPAGNHIERPPVAHLARLKCFCRVQRNQNAIHNDKGREVDKKRIAAGLRGHVAGPLLRVIQIVFCGHDTRILPR